MTGRNHKSNSVEFGVRPYPPSLGGHIISGALQAVIPPSQRLSNLTAAERGIRFDYVRTIAAGIRMMQRLVRALALARALSTGTDSLLVDCDEMV